MKAKLAVIVAAMLPLGGCSSISAGYITAKKYSPAYEYYTQQCSYYDSKGFRQVYMPVLNRIPESFKFDIRNDNGDTGWVYVHKSEFEQFNVGDYYGEKR